MPKATLHAAETGEIYDIDMILNVNDTQELRTEDVDAAAVGTELDLHLSEQPPTGDAFLLFPDAASQDVAGKYSVRLSDVEQTSGGWRVTAQLKG